MENPVPPSATKKTATSRHAVLEELIGIALKHAGDQYLALATRLAGALIDATDGDTRAIQARLRAGNQLRNRNYAFLHLATTSLEQALRRELAALAPAARAPALAGAELSLVTIEEMENKVAMGGVSKPFDALHAASLQTLSVRLGYLLERDSLRTGQNPFRPEVFLTALQQAWTEFDNAPESASLLLPLLKPELFIELGPMFDALNLALQSRGVLAGAADRHAVRRTDGVRDAAAKAKTNQQALAQQLREFFASSDVAGSAAGEIVDGIAGSMLAGVDLTIPDLPAAALSAGGAWSPNAAAVRAGGSDALHGSAVPEQSRQGAAISGGAFGTSAGGTIAMTAAGVAAPPPGYVVHPASFAPRGDGTATAGGTSAAAPGAIATPGIGAGTVPAAGFMPAAGQGSAAVATAGIQQPLLDYLARLQKTVPYESIGNLAVAAAVAPPDGEPVASAKVFYLPHIKQSMPQGSLSRADESTIDLLTAVFDTVFRDQSISTEIRDLIRFLQIPVLKAALVDKNFFFQEAHPARRLLELLSRMGWEQRKNPDDPIVQAMRRSVDRVGRDDAQELTVFAEAVNELEALIDADEKAATAAIAEPIAAALKQEKFAESARLAQDAVALRIGTGEVIAVVEAFLERRWVSVLTIAYNIEDDKPGAVNNATRTMDELIWSVRPKLTSDERRQLIARLPGLLSALNKWLDVIKWQDADRLQFFAELAECHASIVRAPVDMPPERRIEISLQVAQQAAERRLARQARTEVEAQAQTTPAQEAACSEVENLERGMWLSFVQDDGGERKVKLAWISPKRTLYIFSTATRQEAFSMSGEELAQRIQAGRAVMLRTEGVVTTALTEALARSAAIGPAGSGAIVDERS
ncbi:DUF1631 family protein [Duganella callida]|uniref:DUF1631 family protein n=1 Tax=Duganella callida TaxID=2561932 RepID=A0A4Y9SNE1_9BURK|nr:DUF1631 family protein [Duganella callida]TFW26997.1 DUF1631 family protein [Duganella callida]